MPTATASHPTACLVLADGTIFYGNGFGARGETVAELVFNTAMTGYQEIMTDPSYAGQVVTFTFPHIGNTGVTPEDDETATPAAAGMVVKWDPTDPSNWRSVGELTDWLVKIGRIGIGGIDTRRLTRAIRQQGAPHVALAHDPEGRFDIDALLKKARGWSGLVGLDLAKEVSCTQSYRWDEQRWAWPDGYSRREGPGLKVVAIDYGAKRNILRCLASSGCEVTVLPATATAEEVLALNPDGVFLFERFGLAEAVFTPMFVRFAFLEYYENFRPHGQPGCARVAQWVDACLALPQAQQVSAEEVVKLYYDYARGAGNGALLPGRTRSSFSFTPHWRDRPWPPRDKYGAAASDGELGLVAG